MKHTAPAKPIHSLALRVYYEDTDAAGIVYYANYLRYIERGRTEFLRALGHDQNVLMKEGVAFAVRAVSADYLKPAVLDDLLTIETAVASLGRAQMVFVQRVLRGTELLLEAKVRVACIDPVRGKPIRMPDAILDQVSALLDAAS
ncbi:tol-pal system-associated acyl-CoA thioesterase [Sulfuritalea sp.]|uniref:tol-pal system-associated acyl-CoA thioesterase n=1 Tax=Sulfuritalea sp. TaxID=2480090 RepID=UPI001AC7DC66|nr:tol-pal system-associated acyl-CoA thioesterase [Sulfuritalea sp.]MBN8474018.1 tol-pal system-associated acyl-CoA thioesterase [Sulfuritalea sp.]